MRGIDLILEQGLNVKVCVFPEGEDPDSFARSNSLEDLTLFLETHSADFIQYKASLLFEESKNDPIKKAETVRDIVKSISKIPDRIKKEIYVQECSKIMDISEEVLFSTLSQFDAKSFQEFNKQYKKGRSPFDIVKPKPEVKKVDLQYELERKIIELLLLYGNRKEQFEDFVLKDNEEGELILEPVVHEAQVYEKIYLDLQEDEMEFTNENFKSLYYTVIDSLNQSTEFELKDFVKGLSPEMTNEVTTILMNDERYNLHNWESKNIYPKGKELSIAQLVNETILSLRCYLIDLKVNDFKQDTVDQDSNKAILEDVLNYSNLKMLLSRKLNRVL